jgi:uncharacterized membrane protein YgdD (TMEM256/DUF423 family)
MMSKFCIFAGSVSAFLAVGLGAFGAHILKSKLPQDMMEIYQTGVQYHIFHSLGLILIGIIAHWISQSPVVNWSGGFILAGIIVFSGSLYILSITGIRTSGQ